MRTVAKLALVALGLLIGHVIGYRNGQEDAAIRLTNAWTSAWFERERRR